MVALLKLKKESNSRRNFAHKLAEKLFSFSESQSSNCQGKRSKKQLNPEKLLFIKENTLKLWPLETAS